MKVFLTGATGFVGGKVLELLLQAGHDVRCLVRNPAKLQTKDRVEVVAGDIAESLEGKIDGCDAVIHLVGIIREIPGKEVTFERVHFQGTCNVVDESNRAGVDKIVFMSALGVRKNAVANYHKTKYHAEEYIRDSGLKYTIFRPSIIFGLHDKSINLFADMVRKLPVVPVIGNGEYKMQPVALENVAEAFVKALQEFSGEIFEVGGPDQMTYNEVLDCIGDVLGKNVLKLHQPLFLMKPVVAMMKRCSLFPITKDQLTMMLEDNICDEKRFFEAFGITPISLKEGISDYFQH